MPLARAHLDMDCIAVKPTVRSIMMMTVPISFANSARSYMSSMVAGRHVHVVALDLAGCGVAR